MPASLEADLLRLHIGGGHSLTEEYPGLAAWAAPPRSARGREKDLLYLCLSLNLRAAEGGPLPPGRYSELLELATAVFYGSGGSVTAALRQALLAVNSRLLDDNRRTLQEGGNTWVQGGLICAALRGEDLYAVQCGPGALLVAHLPHITPTVERFPPVVGRPLGSGNTVETMYFHTQTRSGEYFILCPAMPAGWNTQAFTDLTALPGLPVVAERLKATADGDFAALVGRLVPAGTAAASVSRAPVITFNIPPAAAATTATPPQPKSRSPHRKAEISGILSIFRGRKATAPSPTPQPAGTDWKTLVQRAERLEQMAGEQLPEEPPIVPIRYTDEPQPAGRWTQLREHIRTGWHSLGKTAARAFHGLRILLARLLPEGILQKDGMFSVPTPVQIGIAIGIPIIVVGLTVWLRAREGQARLFTEKLNYARNAVVLARTATDYGSARRHWEDALRALAEAEQARPGDAQAAELRAEAQSRLDKYDWITRLDYQPLVIGGLGRQVNITEILIVGQEVYALDSGQNRVLRLTPVPVTGYVVDQDFDCAGNRTIGEHALGTLIDLTLIPGPNAIADEAAILALDSMGGLLYCAPGVKALAAYLPPPPTGLVRPLAMEFYAGRLYVLDPGSNEIWQFVSAGGALAEPTHYFTGAVYDLSDVIGFTIAQGEVFLLRRDGRVAHCTRPAAGEAPACTENLLFQDQRPGRQADVRLADVTTPRRLIYDPPPEPSLYLLDGKTAGVYQLSLKLALVSQFRPQAGLPAAAAVAIDPTKRIFIAAGDNVYYAARP